MTGAEIIEVLYPPDLADPAAGASKILAATPGEKNRPTPAGSRRCLTGNQIVPRIVGWEWERRLQSNTLAMIGGETGVGKTTLIASIVAAVTSRCHLPGRAEREPGRVGIITPEEDHESAVQPRLVAAGADMGRLAFLERVEGLRRRRFKLPSGLALFRQVVKQEGLRGLVIDPVSSLMDDPSQANDAGAVRDLIDALMDLCWELEVWCLITRPFRKDSRGRLLDRFMGSCEWGNAPRTVLAVVRDMERQGGRLLAVSKVSHGAEPPTLAFTLAGVTEDVARVVWQGEDRQDSEALSEVQGDRAERCTRKDARVYIRKRIEGAADGRVRVSELIEDGAKNGLTYNMLRRAKEDMNCHGEYRQPEGVKPFWEWGAPSAGFPPMEGFQS